MKKEGKEKEDFKLCSKCGRSKPLSEFYKDRLAKSWYGRICKECERKYATINCREREFVYAYRKEKKYGYSRKYNKNHRERKRESSRKYRQTEAGRLVCKICSQRRRARKVRAGGGGISIEQWLRVIKKQRNKCNVCGKKFTKSRPATIDHIIPISKGGEHDTSNIQALCFSCNSSKSNKIKKELIQSWSI